MLGVSLKPVGQKEVNRAFKKLGAKVGKKPIRKGARAGAKVLAKELKNRTPVGRTRDLRKQVKVRAAPRKRDRILVLAVVTGDGAGAAEFGRGPGGWHKSDLREEPFVRPTFEAAKEKANRVAAETVASETNKEIKNL